MRTRKSTLMKALEEDDSYARWLHSKGNLDYGPFTLSEIVEKINANTIIFGEQVVDSETGQRCNIEDHPLLAEAADTAKQKYDENRRAHAEISHAKQEKSRGAMLYVFVAAAVLALIGGAYMAVKALSEDQSDDRSSLASLEEGSMEATISFPSTEQAKKRRSKSRGKSSPGSKGTSGSWDDSLDFDMAGKDVGTETLSNSQVNPVIGRSGGKLGKCLRSNGTKDAYIEFMIKGTGKVYQVRVNGSTGSGVAKCVRRVMMSMKFPSFNGIRSKHQFDVSF